VRAKISDTCYPRILALASRTQGVVIPEVAETFEVGDDCARRFVLRLIREGHLVRTSDRRRRPHAVEWCRGAGGVVYRIR
jgi:hypothetical protein